MKRSRSGWRSGTAGARRFRSRSRRRPGASSSSRARTGSASAFSLRETRAIRATALPALKARAQGRMEAMERPARPRSFAALSASPARSAASAWRRRSCASTIALISPTTCERRNPRLTQKKARPAGPQRIGGTRATGGREFGKGAAVRRLTGAEGGGRGPAKRPWAERGRIRPGGPIRRCLNISSPAGVSLRHSPNGHWPNRPAAVRTGRRGQTPVVATGSLRHIA